MTINDLPENEKAKAMLAGLNSEDGCPVLIRENEELYFHKNGQLQMRIPKKNEKIHGKAEVYWDNGKLKEVFSIKNHKQEGDFERRFRNGKLKMTGTFKKDKMDDEIKEWFSNGQLRAHYYLKDGNTIGEGKTYNKDGKIKDHWFWAMEEDGTFLSIPMNKAKKNFPEGPWL